MAFSASETDRLLVFGVSSRIAVGAYPQLILSAIGVHMWLSAAIEKNVCGCYNSLVVITIRLDLYILNGHNHLAVQTIMLPWKWPLAYCV